MRRDIDAVLYGLGAVGKHIAKILTKRKGIRIVGAIDIQGIGEDLGNVADIGKELGIPISNDPQKVFSEVHADICLHATDSFIEKVYDQLVIPLKHQVNVITPCEEMAQPYLKKPYIAAKIDKLAKDNGVTLLGTGRAPGFTTDALIVYFTSLCSEIRSIRSERTSSLREYPLASPETFSRMKDAIGVGKTPEQFRSLVSKGDIVGLVGGEESISKIAEALGWKLDKITHEIKPNVKDGRTTGSKMITRGIIEGREVIYESAEIELHETLEEQMATKAYFEIDGVPPIKLTWEPYGIGPIATAALMVNQIPIIIKSRPGVITTTKLPITCALLEDLGGIEE